MKMISYSKPDRNHANRKIQYDAGFSNKYERGNSRCNEHGNGSSIALQTKRGRRMSKAIACNNLFTLRILSACFSVATTMTPPAEINTRTSVTFGQRRS